MYMKCSLMQKERSVSVVKKHKSVRLLTTPLDVVWCEIGKKLIELTNS